MSGAVFNGVFYENVGSSRALYYMKDLRGLLLLFLREMDSSREDLQKNIVSSFQIMKRCWVIQSFGTIHQYSENHESSAQVWNFLLKICLKAFEERDVEVEWTLGLFYIIFILQKTQPLRRPLYLTIEQLNLMQNFVAKLESSKMETDYYTATIHILRYYIKNKSSLSIYEGDKIKQWNDNFDVIQNSNDLANISLRTGTTDGIEIPKFDEIISEIDSVIAEIGHLPQEQEKLTKKKEAIERSRVEFFKRVRVLDEMK